MNESAIYQASPWGSLYHRLPYDEVLGGGAAGPGKTEALLMDPLEQILVEHERCEDKNHPHHIGWGDSTGWALHLRRTIKQLEQSIIRTHRVFPKIDGEIRWDAQKTTWTFSSGYRFQFGHCKDRLSWEDYFSSEFTHIAFDEVIQFEEEQYDQIGSRLRSTDPVLSQMLRLRAMTNPLMVLEQTDNFTVSNPYWVRERFVDPWPAGKRVLVRNVTRPNGETRRLTRFYLPATLDDNPNKAFVEQYRTRLLGMPIRAQEALLKGNWYYVPGAYFGQEWDPDLHVCAPFRIPEDWPIFRSMDWGHKAPGCIGWFTMDPDGTLFCIKELTFQGKLAGEVATIVRQIEEDAGWWHAGRSRITGPADPQLWEERGDMGVTKAKTFQKMGVGWFPGDRGKIRGSAMRLLERLRDHANRTKTPGIVFFKNCIKCIRTIPSIPTDPHDPELPMNGGDDHWCDMVRYACSYASRGLKGIAKVRRRTDPWEEGGDDTLEKGHDRGQYGYGEA